MVKAVVMPKLGQSEETVTIVRWRKQVGDAVAKGDILFEIETDKALLEVESFYEGRLLRVIAREGMIVPVQSTVAFVGELGEPIPDVEPPPPPRPKPGVPAGTILAPPPVGEEPVEPPRPVWRPTESTGIPAASAPPSVVQPPIFKISPRASKLAKECAIDPTPITGTGPGGRIVERDVKAYLEAQGYSRRRITPAAKDLARREGIDLLSLEPKADGTQYSVADIETLIAERPKPLARMRQIIAQRLSVSYTQAPHFFVTVSVDVTELEALRAELKAGARGGDVGARHGVPPPASYTLTDFIVKAAALALQEFPTVNSISDGVRVSWRSKIHVGFAVALDDGLVVPVVRNANELTLAEIHGRVKDLTAKARAGQISVDDIVGSTFTISNLGMMDVENFTAIINPGESAILAVSSVVKQPVVRNDQVVIRAMMKMTLSSDHRLIDGALAARFLNAIRKTLEEASLWQRLT